MKETHRLKEKRPVRILSPTAVLREGTPSSSPSSSWSLWVKADADVEMFEGYQRDVVAEAEAEAPSS